MNTETTVVLSGEAGQGLKTVEALMGRLFVDSGYFIFTVKDVMSRIRGGNNTTLIRVSSNPVQGYVRRIDYLVVFNKNAVERLRDRIDEHTVIIGDPADLSDSDKAVGRIREIRLKEAAGEAGGKLYLNTVIAGILDGLFDLDAALGDKLIEKKFASKGEKVVENNRKALTSGRELAQEIEERPGLEKKGNGKSGHLLSGSQAVGTGALLGGCRFVSSYPMSPATGVLIFMGQHAEEMGLVVEQAEDEIAAVNMNIGSWYSGARALTTTSGGGFALMEEGLSLAGITETPCVIHLAQRPGPATGLPTRTEQGDLEMVLASGHGDFPRLLAAPSDHSSALRITREVFHLADAYQVPSIILTDAYLVDSTSVEKLDLSEGRFTEFQNSITETEDPYQRYQITENGISPRGIPGYGKGLVCCDSDEHDESGHITESFDTRRQMVDKRMRRGEALRKEIPLPRLIFPGGKEGGTPKTLVIAWGSVIPIAKEALDALHPEDTALAAFEWIQPLPEGMEDFLNKPEQLIFVENNYSGQLERHLRRELKIDGQERILKYDGMPFSVEELTESLGDVLKNDRGGK